MTNAGNKQLVRSIYCPQPKGNPGDCAPRIIRVALAFNSLLAQGYSEDMVDWYEVNRALRLDKDDRFRGTIVTGFSDFHDLYGKCVEVSAVKGASVRKYSLH